MHPVVLISRTVSGDAFRYARDSERGRTHEAELAPVPIGTPLPALSRDDVELLRIDPSTFFKDQS